MFLIIKYFQSEFNFKVFDQSGLERVSESTYPARTEWTPHQRAHTRPEQAWFLVPIRRTGRWEVPGFSPTKTKQISCITFSSQKYVCSVPGPPALSLSARRQRTHVSRNIRRERNQGANH